jgi:hypothetical protein
MAPLPALITMALLFACDHTSRTETHSDRLGVTNAQPTMTPERAAAQPGGVGSTLAVDDPTVDQLSHARCALEAACPPETVGGPGPHDECLAQMREAVRSNLGTFACTKGFDGMRVRSCGAAIQRLSCARPVTVLEQIPECTSDSICAQ